MNLEEAPQMGNTLKVHTYTYNSMHDNTQVGLQTQQSCIAGTEQVQQTGYTVEEDVCGI